MKIDIAAISLDVENFRHKKAATEGEAISFLLSNEKEHKVAELAEDIVAQRGLDPSSLLIVTQVDGDGSQFIALEGNRRITALKTLMTPNLASGAPSYLKFKSLHQQFLALNLHQVECVVLDRASASIWIKRKHYKRMGGAGILAWNAVATARSDASEGKITRWMTALAFLEEHSIDAEEFRERISSKTTTVERVFTSTYISSILGLLFEKNGELKPENDDESGAVKLVEALFEAMSVKSFTETKVSTADQQRIFIEGFAALNVKGGAKDLRQRAGNGSSSHASDTEKATRPPSSSSDASGSKSAISSSQSSAATARSKPVTMRKTLASSGLRISNRSLNKFYSELRGLNVEKNPFISAAIIRVFLEKSSTTFLEEMNIPPLNTTLGATWHDYGIKLRTK